MAEIVVVLVIVAVALALTLSGRKSPAPSARAAPVRSPDPVRLDADETFEIEVVGESRFQHALEELAGGRTEDGVHVKVPAELMIVDDDTAGEKVEVRLSGRLVGWLDEDDADTLIEAMEKTGFTGAKILTDALIVGGWDRGPGDRGYFGVKLDLPAMYDDD